MNAFGNAHRFQVPSPCHLKLLSVLVLFNVDSKLRLSLMITSKVHRICGRDCCADRNIKLTKGNDVRTVDILVNR
jgi:hypothetical protein